MAKIIFYVLVFFVLFSACATTHRTEHFNEKSTSFSDSTHYEIRSDAWKSYTSIDSILSLFLQYSMERMVSKDSASEHISETITSYIDSLGREVRNEQRTISRSESRNREQLYQQQLTLLQHKYTTMQEHYDSLFQALYEREKSQNADSISSAATKDKDVSCFSTVSEVFTFICIIFSVFGILYGVRLIRKANKR